MSDRETFLFDDEKDGIVLVASDRFKKRSRENPGNRDRLPEIVTPDGTSGPAEWGRYHDAVREAARSFDNPREGDIHHFLNARARNPEQVDAPAFHEAVKRQRMADLVDIIDHHMRRDGSLPRGSRMVRVQAPRGYMRRALRQSSPDEIAHIHHRLKAIGHDHERINNYLSARIAPDIWDQAKTLEVKFSEGEFSGLLFDDSDGEEIERDEFADALGEALKNVQLPPINIYVTPENANGS